MACDVVRGSIDQEAMPVALSRALRRATNARGSAHDSASQNVHARSRMQCRHYFSINRTVTSFKANSLLLDFPYSAMANKRNVDNVRLISFLKKKASYGMLLLKIMLSELKPSA